MTVILLGIILWIIAVIILLVVFSPVLLRLWSEPVFKKPIVIFESDDWGAGPVAQADALKKISQILSSYQDELGNHPVMTLAVILSIADTKAIRNGELSNYYSLSLLDEKFTSIRQSIKQGVEQQVFTLQLHGKEHYWPNNLMACAKVDSNVKSWLCSEGIPHTEELPAYLQSRWIDSSVLPSIDLNKEDIAEAAKEEVSLFKTVFGFLPTVVVPPTFIWNKCVENAWGDNGLKIVVTPGRLLASRDADGAPVTVGSKVFNGMKVEGKMMYLVRDEYFEPSFGHTAPEKMPSIEEKNTQGRPVLFETHRFNYVGQHQEHSLKELNRLLNALLAKFPDTRFISTEQLAKSIMENDAKLIEFNFLKRTKAWLARIKSVNSFWRFAKISGLAFPLYLMYRII